MGELNNIRRVTEFVITEIEWHDNENSEAATFNGHSLKRNAAIEAYAKVSRTHNRIAVRKTFDRALAKNYLRYDKTADEKNTWIQDDSVKGYRLTKKYFGIPTGLMNEFIRENKTVINIISAFIYFLGTIFVALAIKKD